MAKHKLFCVPGTWEAVAAADGDPGGITPGAEIGMLRGITDFLNRNVFDIVYVNYPASFGPIPGGGEDLLEALGNPSYLKSRDMGVAEVKRLIGVHQGSFGLLDTARAGRWSPWWAVSSCPDRSRRGNATAGGYTRSRPHTAAGAARSISATSWRTKASPVTTSSCAISRTTSMESGRSSPGGRP